MAPKDPVPESEKDEVAAGPIDDDSQKKTRRRSRASVRPYVFHGIRDQAQLQRIADQLYERLRHHELEGEVETAQMVDSQGRAVQGLRFGDPIVFDLADTLHAHFVKPAEQQVQDLLAIGYGAGEAQALTEAVQRLRVPYYVHAARFRFSAEGEGEFSVVVEVRSRRQVEV